MEIQKCKICRKVGKKLFLKGERCYSPKCAFTKRPIPPGPESKRGSTMTDYGREFSEKQKLKAWYGLRETQFKNYVKKVLANLANSKIKADETLVRSLEMRLDNVVFRMGLATSIKQARKLVSHGHIVVNGKKVNVASYAARKGDKIAPSAKALAKPYFQKVLVDIKKYKSPSWIKLDGNTLQAEVSGFPTCEEVALPIQLSSVFEHYSK